MKQRLRIRINLAAINVSFLLNFGAYYSVQGLQSSLNKSIGTQSLSALFVSMTISALFLPPIVVPAIGERKSMAFGTFAYSIYTMANFYPRPYTLIPGAVILGCGGAILWVALRSYIRAMSVQYSSIDKVDKDTITTHFFGVFLAFMSASLLLGNLISSAVFQSITLPTHEVSSKTNISNLTTEQARTARDVNFTETSLDISCGTHNCEHPSSIESAHASEAVLIDSPALYILFGVFAASQILGALVQYFVLTDLQSDDRQEKQSGNCDDTEMIPAGDAREHSKIQLIMRRILATSKINIFDKVGRLMIPLTFSVGLTEGFVMGQLTRDWMTCYNGIEYVGYGISVFGIGSIIASYGSGLLSYVMSRRTMLLIVLFLDLVAALLLLFWEPNMKTDTWLFYVTFGTYGVIYTCRKTLINASYTIFFPDNKEAANSSSTLWMAIGGAVAYVISSTICNRAYIVILMVTSTAGTLLYYAAERIRAESRDQSSREEGETGVELM